MVTSRVPVTVNPQLLIYLSPCLSHDCSIVYKYNGALYVNVWSSIISVLRTIEWYIVIIREATVCFTQWDKGDFGAYTYTFNMDSLLGVIIVLHLEDLSMPTSST